MDVSALAWWRLSDLRTYGRRLLRQAQGDLENRAFATSGGAEESAESLPATCLTFSLGGRFSIRSARHGPSQPSSLYRSPQAAPLAGLVAGQVGSRAAGREKFCAGSGRIMTFVPKPAKDWYGIGQ